VRSESKDKKSSKESGRGIIRIVTFPGIVVGLCLLAGMSGSACVRAQAKAPVATPGLATPEPPERVIIAAPVPEAAEPMPSPPVAPAPRPQTPVPSSRPERPPAAPTTPAVTPAPAVSPDPPPVQLLQTTLNPTEVEKETHAQLLAAQRDLDRAMSRQLSADARKQYDAAKGFIRQAEDAMKAKNLALARTYADKAASLASQLAR
jgi:hypothetical protein